MNASRTSELFLGLGERVLSFVKESSPSVVGIVQEVADNNCVYRNEVHHSADERTQVLQDVASDPTLPRTKSVRCANCQHGEAVFFQVQFFVFPFDSLVVVNRFPDFP